MGCAASLAQVGPVEDPQRITHYNLSPTPTANEIKSIPATSENYFIPKSRNISDSSEISQILNGGSSISPNPLSTSISPPPFIATPDGPLLPIFGAPSQISVDPKNLSSRSP